MSKKYYDRLLTGTGETNREVKSKFGQKMLEQMGWQKGKGLGRNEDGMTECIQIKRREEGAGLGDVNTSAAATFKWGEQSWVDAYNQAAKALANEAVKPSDKKLVSSSSESEDTSDISDFEIEKSTTHLRRHRDSSSKLDKKSKKIKKDKKRDK